MNLTEQQAIVTGASRGIGKAIADELAQLGVHVIGTATSEKGAEGIKKHFDDLGLKGDGMILNVSEQSSIDEFTAALEKQSITPHILVNNAGITRDNLMLRMSADEWNDVINTNLNSVYHLTKMVLRGMMKQRYGRIINITSVVGLSGNAGQSNYAATKAGMIGFTKSLAREVGSRGITVNSIAPGFIQTDMTDALTDEQKNAMLDQIPLSRLGRPEEIAKAAGFLVSEAGAYITGETINVNGGMYMA